MENSLGSHEGRLPRNGQPVGGRSSGYTGIGTALRLTVARARGTVLSLCDRTGTMARLWAEAGFECICADIQHDGIRQALSRV